MKFKISIIVFLLLIIGRFGAFAQNVDPQNVNVSSFSNVEIKRIISEMEKRGLSENEAIALARARGMSEVQIGELRQRISEVKLMGSDIGSSQSLNNDTYVINEVLSQKSELDPREINARIFGFSFFNNRDLSFEPSLNSSVSPSYLLGSGDEISIDVWGASQQSYRLTIDRNGNINIPNIGLISVGGQTLERAIKIINDKLVLIYRDLASEIPRTYASINIGQIKAIKVNVIGEVYVPGTYTVSGASTVFNALYLAGGPNETGSFRDIKVIRDGNLLTSLDVYDYLINGNSAVNISLSDGDVILVSPYLRRVVLEGELKRNGIFEAKDGETIKDLINYAGGYTDLAYRHRLELYRKTSRELIFKNVFEKDVNQTLIQNGDSIVITKIVDRYLNKVSIIGAVYHPGNYELTDSLTLSEIIKNADGLREDAYLKRGIITRLKDDLSLQSMAFDVLRVIQGKEDILLKKNDQIKISSVHDLREFRTTKIFGKVRRPGEYDFKEGMTVEDLIYEAGGFLESASGSYIEVSRKLSKEDESKAGNKLAYIFKMEVPKDLNIDKSEASFKLEPFDQVFIRELPGYAEKAVVKIIGEVAYAGEYALQSKNERISDLVKRAGGLNSGAYSEGAMLTRRVKVSKKVARLREVLLERDSTLEFTDLDFEVIGVSLKKALQLPGSKDDVFLQHGDELYIPREYQTVKVSGEVLNPISTYYTRGKGLKSYIGETGGFGLLAKKSKVYVVYPNGAASNTKRYFFIKKYPKIKPGAEIVVPAKPYREPLPANAWIAMSSALASLALTVITITDRVK